MHLPNEFLNSGAAMGTGAAALASLSFAVAKVRATFTERIPVLRARLATFPNVGGGDVSIREQLSQYGRERMWRMASAGSLIFAAQMVNFPIAHGTSGHLIGGMLAALVVGPLEGLIVVSVVLAIQAFVFGDGGLLVLGANIVNMGVVATLGGYALFRVIRARFSSRSGFLFASFVGAWVSVVFAAIAASLEIAVSGVEPLRSVLPAMVEVHLLIGLAEAVITVAIVGLLLSRGYQLAAREYDHA